MEKLKYELKLLKKEFESFQDLHYFQQSVLRKKEVDLESETANFYKLLNNLDERLSKLEEYMERGNND